MRRFLLSSSGVRARQSAVPVADNARPNATSASNRTVLRPSAASNTIRARFTSRRAVVGARQRASSIFRTFGLSRTSCFGNHPDLESRLPYEEKGTVFRSWVSG